MQQQDGTAAEETAEPSRQELYEDYVSCYRECSESGPCQDSGVLLKSVNFLLKRKNRREDAFTVFPFYQAVNETARDRDSRQHLRRFIKATEVLETLCVNLFLQPWRKEFKTIKTYTGPFVYSLLPVLSKATIHSVLASIGYLPRTDKHQRDFSAYELTEEVNSDRAITVGFELLLARVECYQLLGLLGKDELGPEEWLELLQRRSGQKPEESRENRTTPGQRSGKEKEKEKQKKKEEQKRKEVAVDTQLPPYPDTRPAVNPVPKPRHFHAISADQSITEMQANYPDLAFRGRPLLPDKPGVTEQEQEEEEQEEEEQEEEQILKPGESQQSTAESSEDDEEEREDRPELCSMTSMDEERECEELKKRMNVFHV